MEIKITTQQILKVLQVLAWILFFGLAVEAGAIIVNTCITLFINPAGVENFWEEAGYLSALHKSDPGRFAVLAIVMSIVAVLKSILFYRIIKLFADKKLSISQPFSAELRRFILLGAYLALGIGLFSLCGGNYAAWLTEQGNGIANLQELHLAGADVWLFMAVILFVIAQVVKRGIEIQRENELTI